MLVWSAPGYVIELLQQIIQQEMPVF